MSGVRSDDISFHCASKHKQSLRWVRQKRNLGHEATGAALRVEATASHCKATRLAAMVAWRQKHRAHVAKAVSKTEDVQGGQLTSATKSPGVEHKRLGIHVLLPFLCFRWMFLDVVFVLLFWGG